MVERDLLLQLVFTIGSFPVTQLTVDFSRPSWKDGKPPEKIVAPRYDGLNSYQPDSSPN